jgi:protein phosphatase 1 regulatory subunit 7
LPQITILDGKTLNCVDFVKSENFFGKDLESRKRIFENILPEETFIDRRIHAAGNYFGLLDFLDPESGSEIEEDIEFVDKYDKEGKRI